MEWDYSGRKGRDGQKKKISKANKRKRKVERGKDEEVNGQGGEEGCPGPTRGFRLYSLTAKSSLKASVIFYRYIETTLKIC